MQMLSAMDEPFSQEFEAARIIRVIAPRFGGWVLGLEVGWRGRAVAIFRRHPVNSHWLVRHGVFA
jgi:hypothetical protein